VAHDEENDIRENKNNVKITTTITTTTTTTTYVVAMDTALGAGKRKLQLNGFITLTHTRARALMQIISFPADVNSNSTL